MRKWARRFVRHREFLQRRGFAAGVFGLLAALTIIASARADDEGTSLTISLKGREGEVYVTEDVMRRRLEVKLRGVRSNWGMTKSLTRREWRVREVTFEEWDACRHGGGCGHNPDDEGWGRGNRPVINVSWEDARAYVRWLSRETGERYRLLSESEWEYVARGGARTQYHWGDSIGNHRANCRGCGSRWDGQRTAPVGSFSPTGFGSHDVHGNVWEWVEDCWNGDYRGAPSNGSARGSGDCSRRVLRGGSWLDVPRDMRSAGRNWYPAGSRVSIVGFRVARTLN